VLDHLQGAGRALQRGDQLIADGTAVDRRMEATRLLGVARDGVEGGADVVGDLVGPELAAA
jgi:hypothetical protein